MFSRLTSVCSANTIREPLTICGNGPNGTLGAIQAAGGVTWDTNIVLTCDTIINCLAGSVFTINGVISGAGKQLAADVP